MDILRYNELDVTGYKEEYDRIEKLIQKDDFHAANVKKLLGTPYYRAKLDYENRLIFKIVVHDGKKYALMLEIIPHHDYKYSRFLHGAKINESKIDQVEIATIDEEIKDSISYINHKSTTIHILDKIISFDEIQSEALLLNPPLIIIGSAGSGKTMLTLEKLKHCYGDVLYVTGSPYLVKNAKDLYYSNQYNNQKQNSNFLSYYELLATIKIPLGNKLNFDTFVNWLKSSEHKKLTHDPNRFYEEFRGVITGNKIDAAYLSKEEYLNLGIKQSIFCIEERPLVYEIFEKYLGFLKEKNLNDVNLISFEYLPFCKPKYDFIVVDEVQDFTQVQLQFILKNLKNHDQFVLCGDSHQIVHPNFFSWAKVKSYFYKKSGNMIDQSVLILNQNYRNYTSVTALANNILRLKNARFGSIDKESHYLSESRNVEQGEIHCLANNIKIVQEINKNTAKSTRFAVIVLHDYQKDEARKYFETPLIFSIYEAKGLEYENVILYNFISTEEMKFREIAQEIKHKDLEEFIYARIRDKTDRSICSAPRLDRSI